MTTIATAHAALTRLTADPFVAALVRMAIRAAVESC
jgi:hypothetical protein